MSEQLLEFAKSFAEASVSAAEFSNGFIAQWKKERDDGTLLFDDDELSETLSSIFCLADLYNPNSDRQEYEFDECGLRNEVSKAIGREGKN